MPPTNKFVSAFTLRVRYAETDAMAVVHHSNYVVYFETARSEYARVRGHAYSEFERKGFFLLVAEIHVRYAKAAVYDQLITVRCWIEEMKSRSVVFAYEIVDAESGESLVTGTTKHICIEKNGKVAPIPPEWRAWGQD